MKKFLLFTGLSIIVFMLNFGIYNLSFNAQATPFLQEEQRVASGILMLQTTIPAYIIVSVLTTVILFYLGSKLGVNRN